LPILVSLRVKLIAEIKTERTGVPYWSTSEIDLMEMENSALPPPFPPVPTVMLGSVLFAVIVIVVGAKRYISKKKKKKTNQKQRGKEREK
jgi:hypothetical protein